MKKRLIALILVMVMIASLAACSSAAKPAEQTSSEATEAEQASSEEGARESGDVDAVICAYQPYGSAHDADGNGPFNLNMAAVICAAFGQSVPQGILPVNVPQISETGEGIVYTDEILYERGSGLKDWGK